MLAIRGDGRSMECRRLEMLPIECVVRGYLAGSGWKDYRTSGEVCGHRLPEGLRESDKLPRPIFTPATKAQEGHDENITREQAAELVGEARLREVEDVSLRLYTTAAEHALSAGLIIADTKFELGFDPDGNLVLGDPFLARRGVRARPRARQFRQAVRPRLLRDDRLGQDRPRPRAARRRGPGHPRQVPRGVRTSDDDPVPGVSRRPQGGAWVRASVVRATVLVRPKPTILDPQGEAVSAALVHLGFEVQDARVGKVIDLEVEAADAAAAKAEVERMCEQLLANPLIESYEVEIVG